MSIFRRIRIFFGGNWVPADELLTEEELESAAAELGNLSGGGRSAARHRRAAIALATDRQMSEVREDADDESE